jgi:hypothetical protein
MDYDKGSCWTVYIPEHDFTGHVLAIDAEQAAEEGAEQRQRHSVDYSTESMPITVTNEESGEQTSFLVTMELVPSYSATQVKEA